MRKLIDCSLLIAVIIIAVFVGRKSLAVFYCNRGINYYNQGQYEEAITSYKKSLGINSSVALTHNNLAYAYVENNMDEQAIGEYKKAIQINSGCLSAYLGLSKVYWGRQMYEEAFSVLKQAEQKSSQNKDVEKLLKDISFSYVSYCLEKGKEEFLAADKQKGYALLEKAIETKPDFIHAYYTLGVFYYTDRDYNKAEAMLNKTIELDSRYWAAYKLLGDMYLEKGDYQKAINKYSVATDINANNATLLNDLGLALMQMERYKEAVGYLQEASRLEPENINVRYNLANVYKDAQMYEEAVPEYQRTISDSPDYPNIHNDLGDTFSELNRKEEAQVEYRKEIARCLEVLSKDQNDSAALNSLAYAYNAVGQHKKAEDYVRQAIASAPNYREAYLSLAKIQEKLGQNDEAVASLNKAKALSTQTHFMDRDIDRLRNESLRLFKTNVSSSHSDIVYLKNGRKMAGKIILETDNEIILETSAGNSTINTKLSRDNIERIVKYSEMK
jgi:tetratricopeptide (TPR) repeat protein